MGISGLFNYCKKLIIVSLFSIFLLFPCIVQSQQQEEKPKVDIPEEEEDDNLVNVNFEDVDIQDIVRAISKWTKTNFIVDEKVRGKITVIAPTKVTKKEAYDIFLSVLEARGLTIVPAGKMLKVKPIDVAKQSNITTEVGDFKGGSPDLFITQLLRLKHISVTEMINVLNNIKSRQGSVVGYTPTNTLIITDTNSNIERMLIIINELDKEDAGQEILEVIPVKYAEAATVADIIMQVFSQDGQGGIRGRGITTPRTRRQIPGAPSMPPGGMEGGGSVVSGTESPKEDIRKIIPDERTNSLIILANKIGIEKAKDLLAKLDVKVEETGNIHVYYLSNADAEELAGVLSSLLGGGGGGRSVRGTQREGFGRSTGRRSSRTSSTGIDRYRAGQMDQMNIRDRQINPVNPQFQRGVGTAGGGDLSLAGLEGEVQITADTNTNSLIIVATKQAYRTLVKVIEKLDIKRPQVFVEAAIIEVQFRDTFDWQSEFRSVKKVLETEEGRSYFGGTNYGGIEGVQASIGQGGGLPTGFVFGAADGTINVGGLELPNIGAFLRLLETSSDVNVLSTPQILTVDNEEAEIVVGQNIPFPTGTIFSSGTNTPSITVERQDVGITLRLTPQINESDYIRLQIYHEITGVAQSPTGQDINAVGITTSVRSAQTTVVVRNSQTVAIGGLISDNIEQAESKVPILGDIPILGYLFKTHKNEKRKVNLLLLLTPHIIRTGEDMRKITNEKKQEMRKNQQIIDLGIDKDSQEKVLKEEKEPIIESDKLNVNEVIIELPEEEKKGNKGGENPEGEVEGGEAPDFGEPPYPEPSEE